MSGLWRSSAALLISRVSSPQPRTASATCSGEVMSSLSGVTSGFGHVLGVPDASVDGVRSPLDQGAGVSLSEATIGPGDQGHGSINLHDLAPFVGGRVGVATGPPRR